MMKYLIAMLALVLLDGTVDPPPVMVCSSTPPPLPTYVELDPNPARYAGFGAEGEPLTPWPENDPNYVLSAAGATITYHDQGKQYTHECPAGSWNSYWFEEDQWVKDPEKCWIHKPVKISECK